jgi:hypothetical protein
LGTWFGRIRSIICAQEHSLLGYLGHSPDPIMFSDLPAKDAARLVGYSNAITNPVAGSLTIGASTGFLSSLALPCPCLYYLAQKGVFLNMESLELQYQFIDGVFGHSGQGVGKEMPISRIVIAVPNATVVLLD